MKWLYIGAGIILTTAAIVGVATAIRRRCSTEDTDAVDGGVVKRYYEDMPKHIESENITEFHCTTSLISSVETEGLGHRVYTLDASVKDGEVFVKYAWRDRGKGDRGEYTADMSFMSRLQNIVKDYDLASNNGYVHTVSGLPEMYGDKLSVTYDSGECIYIHDNQSGFISLSAQKELVTLFGAATKLSDE